MERVMIASRRCRARALRATVAAHAPGGRDRSTGVDACFYDCFAHATSAAARSSARRLSWVALREVSSSTSRL